MTIKAVVFDVYGTLVQIRNVTNPYAQLIRLSSAGRSNAVNFRRAIMTTPGFIECAVHNLGIPATIDEISRLKSLLDKEVASVGVFDDVADALNDLKSRGVKVGLCSNLAEAYSLPIRELLPFEPDAISWSFEVGAVKPEFDIYYDALIKLGCEPSEVLFVGDSLKNDVLKPRSLGMKALHLRRNAPSSNEHINSLSELSSKIDALNDFCVSGIDMG